MKNLNKSKGEMGVLPLTDNLRQYILEAKRNVAFAVNSELVQLYWNIGNSIRTEILHESRAEYGKKLIKNISRNLQSEFGKGYSVANLNHFIKFAEVFSDEQIVYTLCRELSWSHLRLIMYLKDELQRQFYIEMCKMERWSFRTLKGRVSSMLYERTAIAKKPDKQIKQDLDLLRNEGKVSSDLIFRDPYVLDFLNLSDTFSEKDLETAILKELQKFITEMGSDFAFLDRQKRITVDGEDYYMDLLFFHRKMKRLIIIELKMDKFRPKDKGQVELYLRWLEKHEMNENENLPVALILCTEKSNELVELLTLDNDQIKVAEFMTVLPPKEILQEKLHFAIEQAKLRLIGNSKEC